MNANELSFLVVDDDDFQRHMVVEILHSIGAMSVCSAENGKHALDLIHQHNEPIDVVICDLHMPEMDGLEFLRHLSQEQRNIDIIIASALGDKLLVSAGKMAKMYGNRLLGVIEKPIMPEQIKGLIAKFRRPDILSRQPDLPLNFCLEETLEGVRARQFEPYFQPKIEMDTGRLAGAEVLARWIHPEHGVVSPYAFVPQLEQSGNVDDLTFLMLEKAAVVCRELHDRGFPITISVNLSQASLNDTMLADKIIQVTRDNGVDPQSMVLEITETMAMTDIAYALENLARLAMHGFSLSIDDYGTGYSSLQQLTRIAFSELKIDQSFVRDIADNETSRIIVESSIDMARKLKVKSVAEGVETEHDRDILKQMGCDIAQGFLFARPMNKQAFVEYCTESRHSSVI